MSGEASLVAVEWFLTLKLMDVLVEISDSVLTSDRIYRELDSDIYQVFQWLCINIFP